MNQNKTALYLVVIVGIIAFFGLFTLIINVNKQSSVVSYNDLTGEAYGISKISISPEDVSTPSSSSQDSASLSCCRKKPGSTTCACYPTEGSCADC